MSTDSFRDGDTSAASDKFDFLPQQGEMAQRIRAFDWRSTPLGDPSRWSPTLRMVTQVMLANRFPHLLWWGPDYVQLYNDYYIPILGAKHPQQSLGKPFRECWHEVYDVLGPLVDIPYNGGPATWVDDIELVVRRSGLPEESHFLISYSAVPDDTAPRGIGGVLGTVHEITDKVITERRVKILSELSAGVADAKTDAQASSQAIDILARYPKDLPFALLYLVDEDQRTLRLVSWRGLTAQAAGPATIGIGQLADSDWPLQAALATETLQLREGLANRLPPPPAGLGDDPLDAVVAVPLKSHLAGQPLGVLVVGLSAYQRPDAKYLDFLGLLGSQVATAVASARAFDAERRRAEALAEIDRAKTAFFSNVSHEFRTPLTLMLGPIEDSLAEGQIPATVRRNLEVAERNALRLLKLVNSLLDFSRIEAGRVQASFVPVDLAALTADLASTFRSAMQRAQLGFEVETPPLGEPVYVDRDLWEKVVLNLLSNAFKFTLEGAVRLRLSRAGDEVLLEVTDTGVGVPESEVPHLFDRFHRVEGTAGRSHEGSGIGLALVQELVRLHGGSVEAESRLGLGSTFRVRLPFGSAHLDPGQVRARGTVREERPSAGAQVYVQEALRGLPQDRKDSPDLLAAFESHDPKRDRRFASTFGAHILVADDNADMRDYLRELLSPVYRVELSADGEAALSAARREPPALIIADVMMPRLDGFGLLESWRADAQLRDIPVILLSARAGEESLIEGLGAGADDYLVKPFYARELLARVGALLELTALRRSSEERFRAYVQASSDVVYRMNADWSEMLHLEGRSFIADQTDPNRSWQEKYILEDDRARVRAEIDAAVRERRVFELEHRVLREDGSTGWTFSRAIPILDADGRIQEWFGAASDVTERRNMQEALRELNTSLEQQVAERTEQLRVQEDALRQAQKMEAVGQLTGGIAHDFNNLLQVIVGNLELIRRLSPPDAVRIGRAASQAMNGASQATALTQRLLAFARRQPLDPKPVDVNRLVGGMSELLNRSLGETIAVETVHAAGLWRVEADPNALESAILNLAVNARDAMPGGGRLTIETMNAHIDQAYAAKHAELRPGQYVVISISDTGSGMDAQTLQRVFEPFFTTKPVGKGTGLGLSQVYGFAKQSGGHVKLYSELGQGTTVRMYLPRIDQPVDDPAPQLAEPPPSGDAGETILVVEDDNNVRAYTVDALRELGYQVIEATDGPTALRLLQSSLEIDLLFTDVVLPGGMTGAQIAAQARSLHPTLKVLFTTGYARNAIVHHGRLDKGVQLLTKPFVFADLAAKVRDVLDGLQPAPPG